MVRLSAANTTALRLAEQASAPATPAGGFGLVYVKADGLLYWKDDAGTEHAVIEGGDTRLTDARTPTAHATSHQVGGGDAFTGIVPGSAFAPGGLTGATQASRYVGATASGAPASGTFAVGDFVIARDGTVWVCTTAGSPGTWTEIGGAGGSVATDAIWDAAGDLAVGSGANTAAKLTMGTALQQLRVNTGATGLEWAAPAGGGAPTSAEYVTTASDGTLSAEVAIPGLAGSPDRAGVAGATFADEYDTGTHGLTFTPSSPAALDSDTTVPSHLYARWTDTTERLGYRAFSPAGAFDARARVSVARVDVLGSGDAAALALIVADAANTSRAMLQLNHNTLTSACTIIAFTYSGGSYTQRGSTQTLDVTPAYTYLRLTRDGSNTIGWYVSRDGVLWTLLAAVAFTLTVTQIGYRMASGASGTCEAVVDWLRAG